MEKNPLSLFCLILSFLAVPGARAAVTVAIKPTDTMPTCAEADSVSGHRYKPGCKETIKRGGESSDMQYNSQGLRDKDYPGLPAKGWHRVLFVGTSNMAGPGIAEKETAPRKLEGYLRKSDKKVEVINAGVEGYMPLNQVTRIKDWLKTYSPTHVILQVELASALSTDVMNAPYFESEGDVPVINRRVLGKMKPFAFLLGLDSSKYQDMTKILTWQSGAFRAWRTNYCKLRYRESLALTNCLMISTVHAIEKIYRYCREAGVKFQAVISPGIFSNDMIVSPAFDADVATRLDGWTPRISINSNDFKRIMDKRSVPAIFGPSVAPQAATLPGDYHFNASGADTYARSLSMKLGAFLDRGE